MGQDPEAQWEELGRPLESPAVLLELEALTTGCLAGLALSWQLPQR